MSKLDNPIANIILGAMGVNKQDFKNGLQAVNRSDYNSTSTLNSSLLDGIDQLYNK